MPEYLVPDEGVWSDPGPDGSTPLDADEADGLIPSWVATRGDLNTVEQANIVQALSMTRWQGRSVEQLLDDLVARQLHKDMFRDVWKWAGTYRLTERNIGVDPVTISVCVRDLMEDAKAWIGGQSPMEPDVVGCRFHHRLVQVHPFPNGNGRHARAMTDLLLRSMGQPPFSWGRTNLDAPSATRTNYIAALRAADDRRFDLLAQFVRS
jgi:Fic-DOC domain mobile mystery protein B